MPTVGTALVIDDDQTVHLVMKSILERLSFQVHSALDGMQGLMMIRQLQPKLLVLDMMMPAGGGASLHDRVKQMKDTFQIPILIYSAVPRAEILKRIQESPTVAILNKPATPEQVLTAVMKICRIP